MRPSFSCLLHFLRKCRDHCFRSVFSILVFAILLLADVRDFTSPFHRNPEQKQKYVSLYLFVTILIVISATAVTSWLNGSTFTFVSCYTHGHQFEHEWQVTKNAVRYETAFLRGSDICVLPSWSPWTFAWAFCNNSLHKCVRAYLSSCLGYALDLLCELDIHLAKCDSPANDDDDDNGLPSAIFIWILCFLFHM